MDFSDLGLGPELLRAVSEAGYQEPTPIQTQAIPVVLMGRDVLGCAQTGTGKTASFTLPMIDILSAGRAKARMPRSLILEPTRELAAQVAQSFEKYGKYHALNHALIIGGEGFTEQEQKLMRGVDVLIATPGRLIDLFERGKILLIDVKILVIDEADRMLDMGFIPDVERIVSMLPKIRQTLLFSATMAPEVKRLADAFLMNPKEISASPSATTATTVTQGIAIVSEMDKREALRRLIRAENVGNALIFCNRKIDVEILYKSLTRHGFKAARLHGDMAQPKRVETLDTFKRGEASLLVCSDVAARGLDIAGLSHVFNFDVPTHAEDYVHRIGRTGRAGREGRALMLATPEDGKNVSAIVKLIGQDIPTITIEGIEPQVYAEGEGLRRGRRPGGGQNRSRGGTRDKSDSSNRKPRNRPRPEELPAASAIDQAIPHPITTQDHHDRLAASAALPAAVIAPVIAPAGTAPAITPVQSAVHPLPPVEQHHNRHERRSVGKPRYEEDTIVAGHGFGDHLPAFLRRPVRLPAGE